MFVQQLLNGITQGGLFAMLALSYSIVYDVLTLVNFATGSIYMLGAFAAWALVTHVTHNLVIAIAVAAAAGYAVSFGLEKIAFRTLRGKEIASLICTIGFSQLLNELISVTVGRDTQSMPKFFLHTAFTIGQTDVSYLHIILIAVVLLCLLFMWLLMYHSKIGFAIRSISQDYKTAGLMGIDVDRTISIAFSAGGACAGIAGILAAIYYSTLSPVMGVLPGLKSFAAAVFGGLTSMPGAILGGYLLGIIENFGVQAIGSGYRDVISFVILIVFLLARPQGILGKKKAMKV